MHTHARRSPVASACAVVGGLGLAAATVGTFLPWLQSGEVSRNSYASAGALQRLANLNGAVGTALDAWPFLGLFCAAVAIGFVTGLERTAALCALVIGIAACAVAVLTLRTTGAGPLHHLSTGPGVTATGALAAIVAATLFLISHRSDVARTPGRTTR